MPRSPSATGRRQFNGALPSSGEGLAREGDGEAGKYRLS